jgi:hypothetical protein
MAAKAEGLPLLWQKEVSGLTQCLPAATKPAAGRRGPSQRPPAGYHQKQRTLPPPGCQATLTGPITLLPHNNRDAQLGIFPPAQRE